MTDAPIVLEGITKRYPHFTLAPLDLAVPAGRVLGLIGPNGAGKSTLIRIIVGLVRADAGVVTVLGRRMPGEQREIKRHMAFVSDDMALYRGESLRWHLDWVRRLAGRWDEDLARDLLDRFALHPSQRAGGLSRGQQAKALLLLALARRPDVLVLDEPTTGLDPLVRRDVIDRLAACRGTTTMVFSSHMSEDISGLADAVAFLHGGRIIAQGAVAEFVRDGHSLEHAFLDRVDRLALRGAA